MAQYVEVAEAVGMPGLRVVLSPGVPGPWSEAAKGILYVKKISYVKVRQELAGENRALLEWTKQTTAPVFVYNDERPRSIWIDQLYLAERLEPNPPLIPGNIDDRVLMFGLADELCGENGYAWCRRLMLVHAGLNNPNLKEAAKKSTAFLGAKYGYAPHLAEAAPGRVAEIVQRLGDQLEAQRERGSRYLIGGGLTALDIYWAAFAALLKPLPDEHCKISPAFRKMYTCDHPAVAAAMKPLLFEHRDFIYQQHLELPLDM